MSEWLDPNKAPYMRRILVKGILIPSFQGNKEEKLITVAVQHKSKDACFWILDKFEKNVFHCTGWQELPSYD